MYVCMQRPRHMTHMIIASGCKMMTFGTLAELFREECLSEATTTSSGRGLELEFGDDWSFSAVILDWGRSFLVSGLEGVIFLFFAVFIYSYLLLLRSLFGRMGWLFLTFRKFIQNGGSRKFHLWSVTVRLVKCLPRRKQKILQFFVGKTMP
jgi:hypothetical protein